MAPTVTEPAAFNRFNSAARKTLELALREALARGNNYIGPAHILLALITQGEVPEGFDLAALTAAVNARAIKRPTLEERVQALEDKLDQRP